MQLFHQSFKYLRAGPCGTEGKCKGRTDDWWISRESGGKEVGRGRTGGVLEIYFGRSLGKLMG